MQACHIASAAVLALILAAAVEDRLQPVSPVLAAALPDPGAVLFHEKGCEHCHGSGGVGSDRAPDLTGVGRRLSRLQIEHQIYDGGQSMPPFGDALEEGELKSLVEYLHSSREKPKPSKHAKRSQPPKSEHGATASPSLPPS